MSTVPPSGPHTTASLSTAFDQLLAPSVDLPSKRGGAYMSSVQSASRDIPHPSVYLPSSPPLRPARVHSVGEADVRRRGDEIRATFRLNPYQWLAGNITHRECV